jgi:hypothetical protein
MRLHRVHHPAGWLLLALFLFFSLSVPGISSAQQSSEEARAAQRVGSGDLLALQQEDQEPDDAPQETQAAPTVRWEAPSNITATDNPNDDGHGILLKWEPSPDDASILAYEVFRAPSPDAPESEWIKVGSAPRGMNEFEYTDNSETVQGEPNPKFVQTGEQVFLTVRAVGSDGSVSPWTSLVSGVAKGNWFHTGKTNLLVVILVFGLGVVFFINQARGGREFYVRPIPGLGAVDEAIGRATEMGKPILYVLGTGTAGDIATIAGYTILSRVAKKTAEYQTPILVPVNDPVMLAMGQEVVKEAYLQAGRPDVYNPDNISYISALQFPYVAAVNGLMLREKTATNFYMGVFHAESLLLAETGSVTGAIQISGTDQLAQIPFFVAATDYTLIGEELYAASAYLSQEPKQIGPLKAQDLGKIIILIFIVAGVLGITFFGWEWIKALATTVI